MYSTVTFADLTKVYNIYVDMETFLQKNIWNVTIGKNNKIRFFSSSRIIEFERDKWE